MATYQLTSPQGDKYNVTAPDDATQEQVAQFFQQNSGHPDFQQQATKPLGQDAGKGQAFVNGVNESVPFGGKVTSAIGAAVAKPFTDQSFGDLYNQAEANAKTTDTSHLGYNVLGNLAGTAETIPFAATKVAQAAGDFVKGGNLAQRAGKAALVAAPIGAAYGAGAAAPGEMAKGAAQGAVVSGALGVAGPLAVEVGGHFLQGAATALKGYLAPTADALQGVLGKVYAKSSADYQAMRDVGATLTSDAANSVAGKVQDAVQSAGDLIPEIHGKTLGVLKALQNSADDGSLDINKLDQYRRLFSRISSTHGEDEHVAGLAKSAIDDAVNSLGASDLSNGNQAAVDSLNQARAGYAKASRLDDIVGIIQKSEGNGNALKRNLTNFMNKDGNTAGWSPEEIDALKNAATNTTGEKVLRLVGKAGVDLGGSKTAGNYGIPVLEALAGAATGAHTLGVPLAAGTVANVARNAIARGKTQSLVGQLLSRTLPEASAGAASVAENTGQKLLAAPGKLSALPMTDKQVGIAQALMNKAPATGDELSGTAVKASDLTTTAKQLDYHTNTGLTQADYNKVKKVQNNWDEETQADFEDLVDRSHNLSPRQLTGKVMKQFDVDPKTAADLVKSTYPFHTKGLK